MGVSVVLLGSTTGEVHGEATGEGGTKEDLYIEEHKRG